MKIVESTNAPKAIGPYSQAIICNGMLYTSGQIPLDPVTGAMVGGADVKAQPVQVFKNLEAVLEAAGCTFQNVVKATVFLTTMDHFAMLNEVYGEYLGDRKPARSTVAVAGLPKGSLVEIEVIAAISAL